MKINAVKCAGFSFTEVIIGLAIASFIFLIMGSIFHTVSAMMVNARVKKIANEKVLAAMNKVETLLSNANRFDLATSSEVIFVADLSTDPKFDKDGDFDGDGVRNADDPNMDNDVKVSWDPANNWKRGYNLQDDDDDNDGRLDMRWWIAADAATRTLWLDYQKNEEPWGSHRQQLMDHISTTTIFSFFSSNNSILTPGASMYQNVWGQVTQENIDKVPPDSCGNGNGTLDTRAEMDQIVSVRVSLGYSLVDNGRKDAGSSAEILPPPLYLKRLP